MSTQSEVLRAVAQVAERAKADRDPPCFPLSPDDSSRNVTGEFAERTEEARPVDQGKDRVGAAGSDTRAPLGEPTPTTSAEAIKLAIKLAVDAGEYERAAALLDVAKRTTKPASVTPIDVARGRER